ncbi:MAG: hypothetical protein HZY76_11790 [Anaerolineae bacterium]|nr:MAG: hypothetical protein HZY76_11790 [Anaerolineae bacterium]
MTAHTSDTSTRRLEIIAAIILSLASLLTAWSSYQAAQWSRTQSIKSNSAVTRMVESSQFSTLASQDALVDVITFTGWLEAMSTGDQVLADFYRALPDGVHASLRGMGGAQAAAEPGGALVSLRDG